MINLAFFVCQMVAHSYFYVKFYSCCAERVDEATDHDLLLLDRSVIAERCQIPDRPDSSGIAAVLAVNWSGDVTDTRTPGRTSARYSDDAACMMLTSQVLEQKMLLSVDYITAVDINLWCSNMCSHSNKFCGCVGTFL